MKHPVDEREKRILVTGGAGFIGSALVRKLVDDTDALVVNVDKLTYAGNLDSLAGVIHDPRHRFERLDICDRAALARVFEETVPTAVVHLAAESHVDRSIDGPATFVQTNLVGTFTLLEEARRHLAAHPELVERFRFLHVSTDEVYGSLDQGGFFDEASRYEPSSPYSATKAGADHLARAWHRTYGVPVMVTNCSNNYGPYQFPEKLIPHMILRGLQGRELPVYGRGENVRDWLHVDDHAEALLAVLERGRVGETYLLGGREPRRNLEVVRIICGLLDELAPSTSVRAREDLIRFVEDRPGHDLRYAIDPGKADRELGWRPGRSFDVGLRDTVRWYIENQTWWERVISGAYRVERLGLGRALAR